MAVIGLIAITVPLVYDQLILLSKTVGEVITDFSSKFEINFEINADVCNDIVYAGVSRGI